ncbi:MlaD family protein [Patulibacter defluvii]|uniref:MlaD family protein n=1 Tax=Patulibacter defluvii TaxID=3095358 RepID=UPI002A749E4B|nr:MlaD family protein [Patulibacter sp. DM4]
MRRPQINRAASRSAPRPVLWLLGLAGIGAVVVMFLIGYNAPNTIPGRSYYTVKAQFDHADNLTAHYQVRIAGRYVGQVLNPRVQDGKAIVDLQLQPDVGPLKSDTTLRVRPRSPIGVRFVELAPGEHGQPLADGATIPASQTSAATELDEVLNTLDAPRRAQAQTFMQQLGAGVLDRGEDVNDLIDRTPRTLTGVDRLMGAVNARGGAPERFVAGSESAAGAADPVRETIRQGFQVGSDALQPFANGGDQIRATLETAPPSLATAREGLRATDPLLVEVSGFSRALLPALRPAPRGLNETSKLLRDSRAGLRSLRTTLDTAEDATPPTLKLLETADPVLPSITTGLRHSLPLADRFGAHGCDLGLFTRTWGSMLTFGVPGGRKDLGLITNLRLLILSSEETIGGWKNKSGLVADNPYPAPCTVTQDARSRK